MRQAKKKVNNAEYRITLAAVLAWAESRDGTQEADETALREIQEMVRETLGLKVNKKGEYIR